MSGDVEETPAWDEKEARVELRARRLQLVLSGHLRLATEMLAVGEKQASLRTELTPRCFDAQSDRRRRGCRVSQAENSWLVSAACGGFGRRVRRAREGPPIRRALFAASSRSAWSRRCARSAWQLELGEQISKLGTPPRHKIRLMWFGGEEEGLVGSQYYAANLSQSEIDKIDAMIDTDMIASPNYVRLVYDGDGNEAGPAGPPGSGVIEDVFKRYFQQRDMATLAQAFDGRSDYVGFINRGIPGGGIFAGAEVLKSEEEVAVFGGVAGEQYDPCYHEACDNIDMVTGQPPASTMEVFATDPALAQVQANSLNGNALKSLREMSGAVTHAVWYFARVKNALPPRATTARAARKHTRTYRFKYQGHRRARTR